MLITTLITITATCIPVPTLVLGDQLGAGLKATTTVSGAEAVEAQKSFLPNK